MKKIIFIVCLTTLVLAQSKNATITLYRDGYGLVKQPISFNLVKGRTTVLFTSLPEKLESDSPFLSLGAKADVLYQRYNYDLFNTREFLKAHLGEEIEVTLTSGKSYDGRLLDIDGNIITISRKREVKLFNYDQVVELKIPGVSPKENLTPQLTWEIKSERAGRVSGDLIYLSRGFDWRTGYRLIISPDENSGTLITEAVVDNNTNLDFENVRLQLVEGQLKRVHRRQPPRPVRMVAPQAKLMAEDVEPTPSFIQEEIADYKIYTLSEPLQFPSRESITASLYSDKEIKISRLYKFENKERSTRDEPLTVQISFVNNDGNNLGLPLPGGTVQMYYTRSDGAVEFTGEDYLKQVPKGEEAKVIAGKAFDVIGKRTVVNYDRKRKSEEATIKLELKNKRKDEISVQLIEHIYGDWVIKNPTHDYIKIDAQTIQFDLKIAPESVEVVSYTYRKEWK